MALDLGKDFKVGERAWEKIIHNTHPSFKTLNRPLKFQFAL